MDLRLRALFAPAFPKRYTALIIAADGHVLFNGPLHAIDDAGALAKARDWAKDYSVDVWDGLRFLGHVGAIMPPLAEAQASSA